MAVHGRPALLHELPNDSRPAGRPAAHVVSAGRAHPNAAGVLLGVRGELGYRCPGGIDYRLHDWPATAPLASITLPYLLELAHEPNSYR
jgi:hypothetical protein